VDASHSHESRAFIRAFNASPNVQVATYSNSIDEARQRMGRQEGYGILYFPRNYAERLHRGEQAHVSVYCDMSLMLAYKAVFQTAQSVATKLNSSILLHRQPTFNAHEDELATEPLAVAEVPIFNATGGYGNAILPGVLILILQQALLLGIGMAAGTARERNRQGYPTLVNTPEANALTLIIGKALFYFMVFSVMAAYLTLVVPHLFHFTALASASSLIALLMPYLLAVIFAAMALSFAVRQREQVMLLVVFTSVPLLFLTGISWPESNMPWIWESVAYLFPSTFAVRGFLRISSMGATLSDIQPELMGLWLQAVVYFGLAWLMYALQRRRILNARK
jgi:putative transporter